MHRHERIVKFRVQFTDSLLIHHNPFAEDRAEPCKVCFGETELETKYNRHRRTNKSPEDTRNQELTGNHLVVGAENVMGQKVRLVLVAVMMFMKMVVIPFRLEELFFHCFNGGSVRMSHNQRKFEMLFE